MLTALNHSAPQANTPGKNTRKDLTAGDKLAVFSSQQKTLTMPNSTADIQSLNKSLIAAAQAGQIEKVKELLDQGADVNTKDEDGRTVIIHAIVEKNEEILKILLKKEEVNVNAKDDTGWTPLIYATQFDNMDAFDKLLNDPRVEITARDRNEIDALTYADYSGNEIAKEKIIKKLEENYSMKNNDFSLPEGADSSPAPEVIGVPDPILVSF